MNKKPKYPDCVGSSLESFFEETGALEEVMKMAQKKVVSGVIDDRRRALGMSKTELAKKMRTSRSALDRLLDENDVSITLDTLVRAARALGLGVRIVMDPEPRRSKRAA